MTYHIKSKDYQCKNCDAVFIPFHNDIVCPKCKTPATGGEAFDYIERICSSMRVHKRQFGQFMPSAWYTNNSLTENIQELCFRLYDELEEEKPNNEQKSLTDKIASLDLGEKYLNTHLKDIALAIYPIYKKENKFDISSLPWKKNMNLNNLFIKIFGITTVLMLLVFVPFVPIAELKEGVLGITVVSLLISFVILIISRWILRSKTAKNKIVNSVNLKSKSFDNFIDLLFALLFGSFFIKIFDVGVIPSIFLIIILSQLAKIIRKERETLNSKK